MLVPQHQFPSIKWPTGGRPPRLLAVTSAPAQYDGFGTVAVAATHEANSLMTPAGRVVAIDPEHYEWQARRYLSGMYCCVPLPFPELPSDV